MGDGILDKFPCIQDQTSPNLAHIPTTNLILNSEAISLTPTKNGTFVDNFAISPDGTQNATKLTATTTDPFFYQNITFNAGVYTASLYVKGIGSSIGKDFRFAISSSTHTQYKVPAEWTRFEFSATIASGTASTGVEITDPAVVGDEVLIWGWQVEKQSQATAYLPSYGIASVRKATTTNLVLYSEDYTSIFWEKQSATITPNSTTSPIGTLTADKITKLGDNANDRIKTDIDVINSTVYTISAFVKNSDINNGGVSTISARISGGTLFRQGYEWNGSSLSVTSSQQGGTRTNVLLQDSGNDWWKIGFSFTTNGTSALIEIDVDRDNGSDNTSLFAWGIQLEQQTQAETYAKTTGLPVTIDLFTENNYGTMINMTAGDIVPDTPNN
jgi:hypothetical protein